MIWRLTRLRQPLLLKMTLVRKPFVAGAGRRQNLTPMLTHIEGESGAPVCGSTNPDPDLTGDLDEVTCKQCLEAQGSADANETDVATRKEEAKGGPRSGSRGGRSDFLSYEEVLKICSKKSRQ